MTAPISASLISPLMKFASAIFENSRLKPAAGEILESFGLSCSPDQTRRCCTMLPTIAASMSSSERQRNDRDGAKAEPLHRMDEAAPVDRYLMHIRRAARRAAR